jgi:hypothetical protein
MAQQLKRWESPRRKGRNHKGRGGTARQRQLAKRHQTLRKRLKETATSDNHSDQRGVIMLPSSFLGFLGDLYLGDL